MSMLRNPTCSNASTCSCVGQRNPGTWVKTASAPTADRRPCCQPGSGHRTLGRIYPISQIAGRPGECTIMTRRALELLRITEWPRLDEQALEEHACMANAMLPVRPGTSWSTAFASVRKVAPISALPWQKKCRMWGCAARTWSSSSIASAGNATRSKNHATWRRPRPWRH